MLASRVGLLASLARRAGRGEAGLGLGLKQGEGLLRVPRHLGLPRAAVAAERGAQAKASFSSSNEAVSEDLLIDTLEVMRGFERSGLKREEADVLTRHVTKLILQTSNQFSAKFASQVSRLFPRSCPAAVARPFSFPCLSFFSDLVHPPPPPPFQHYLDKLSGKLGSDMQGFKSEILKTQELQLSTMQKEIEATKQELAKLRTEIRYELDKMISSQRLDLNLEKGRLRDELQATNHTVQTIETQLNKDLNNIRTGIEANKNELIKYSIGLLVSTGAIALGILRFLV